jgi:hypothetical protein
MIVPAADAARAVAYSPEDTRDISYINRQMLLNLHCPITQKVVLCLILVSTRYNETYTAGY